MLKKIIINFLLLFLNNLVHSIIKFGDIFKRTDCYISLTDPLQYLEIESSFSTAPLYLHTIFNLKIYHNKNDINPIETQREYPFVRINEPCKNSLLFSTKGIQFEEIVLSIIIKIFDHGSTIATFLHNLKNGFLPGRYILLSRYSTMGLILKIQYFGEEYMQVIKYYIWSNLDFLLVYTRTYNDICVVTNNNGMVVIRPIYDGNKPDGFISYIYVSYEDVKNKGMMVRIPAFECDSNELNPNTNVILFDENSVNAKLTFYTGFRQIKNSSDEFVWTRFILSNVRRENINKSNQYKDVKKLFLINEITESEDLNTSMCGIFFKSSTGEIYRTLIIKKTDMMFNIVRSEHINLY